MSDTGLKFLGSVLSPFLYTKVMLACFHETGTVPFLIEIVGRVVALYRPVFHNLLNFDPIFKQAFVS